MGFPDPGDPTAPRCSGSCSAATSAPSCSTSRTPADRDRLLRLLDGADVLVENLRPGALERLGLDPADLLARNPRLVVTRVTGFGQDGPYASRPGFATLAEAMSGFAAINGEPDGGPLLPPIALTDEVTALAAAFATMAAVHSGVGQVVDVNLLETMLQLMGPLPAAHAATGYLQPRLGSGIPYSVPRGTWRCADGRWVAVSTSHETVARRVLDLIGLGDDEELRSFAGRVAARDRIDDCLAGVDRRPRPSTRCSTRSRRPRRPRRPSTTWPTSPPTRHLAAREALVERRRRHACRASSPACRSRPARSATPDVALGADQSLLDAEDPWAAAEADRRATSTRSPRCWLDPRRHRRLADGPFGTAGRGCTGWAPPARTSRHARRFGAVGEGTGFLFPPGPCMNEQLVRLGERTLVGPEVSLSAGMWPGEELEPEADGWVVRIGDRVNIGRRCASSGASASTSATTSPSPRTSTSPTTTTATTTRHAGRHASGSTRRRSASAPAAGSAPGA